MGDKLGRLNCSCNFSVKHRLPLIPKDSVTHMQRLAVYVKGPSIKYVRKIFRKTNISNPLKRTRTCAYQGVRNVSFRKILRTYLMDDLEGGTSICTGLISRKFLS